MTGKIKRDRLFKTCDDCEWFEPHPTGGRCHEPGKLDNVNAEDTACEFFDGGNHND